MYSSIRRQTHCVTEECKYGQHKLLIVLLAENNKTSLFLRQQPLVWFEWNVKPPYCQSKCCHYIWIYIYVLIFYSNGIILWYLIYIQSPKPHLKIWFICILTEVVTSSSPYSLLCIDAQKSSSLVCACYYVAFKSPSIHNTKIWSKTWPSSEYSR